MEKCFISHPSSIPHGVLVAVWLDVPNWLAPSLGISMGEDKQAWSQTGWPLIWECQWGKTTQAQSQSDWLLVWGSQWESTGSLVPSFLAPRFGLSMGEDQQAQSETEWSLILRSQ